MKGKRRRTSRQKGFHYERQLARKLWSLGFAVVRGPGSGGGSKEIVQPDLVAIKNNFIAAIEIKVRWSLGTIYVPKDKISRLSEFARRASGRAFIAIKIIDHIDWKFIPVEKLETTANGNYKIKMESLREALTLNGLLSLADGASTLEEYV